MSATRRIGIRRDANPVAVYLRTFGSRAGGALSGTRPRGERARSDATTGAVTRALRDRDRPR